MAGQFKDTTAGFKELNQQVKNYNINNLQNDAQTHWKNKVAVVNERDSQMWFIITSQSIPHVSMLYAIISLFLNLLIPGSGTCFAACV